MLYRTSMSSSRSTTPLTVGSMLRLAWTEVTDDNRDALAAAGFDDLRYDAHRMIIRDMLVSNLRPSQLGARLGLSKQAANDLVREYEAKGYITLEPDPDDGRAKRIVATERGRQAVEIAMQSSKTVGHRWATQVGEERYAVFEEVLREITTANSDREPPR